VVVNVELVLWKEGRDLDHLVAGLEDRLEDGVEPAGGADGHDHLFGGEGEAMDGLQVCGDSGTHLGEPGVGHVAVASGLLARRLFAQRLPEGGGGLDHRVSQREVADLGLAMDGLEACPLLVGAADVGATHHELGDVAAVEHVHSSLAEPPRRAKSRGYALGPVMPPGFHRKNLASGETTRSRAGRAPSIAIGADT